MQEIVRVTQVLREPLQGRLWIDGDSVNSTGYCNERMVEAYMMMCSITITHKTKIEPGTQSANNKKNNSSSPGRLAGEVGGGGGGCRYINGSKTSCPIKEIVLPLLVACCQPPHAVGTLEPSYTHCSPYLVTSRSRFPAPPHCAAPIPRTYHVPQ